MTTPQIHLVMLGLGVLAYVLLAGPVSYRHSKSKTRRRKWRLGTFAGLLVALSPLSRFWHVPRDGIDLLIQSLLISAISLLVLLLLTLLREPIQALLGVFSGRPKSDYQADDDGLPSIVIDANTPSALDGSLTDDVKSDKQLLSTEKSVTEIEPVPSYDVQGISPEQSPERDSQNTYAVDDQSHISKADTAAIASELPLHGERDSTHQLDENISRSNAANDQTTVQSDAASITDELLDNPISDTLQDEFIDDAGNAFLPSYDSKNENTIDVPNSLELSSESFDLSDTEALFAEMRTQDTEVELPGEDELQEAKDRSAIDELNFDSTLVYEEKDALEMSGSSKSNVEDDLIEEAEVLDADESNLDFGNDLTGAYAHPTTQTQVPATLEDAMIAAKVSAISLQAQVASLEETMVELDGFRDYSLTSTRADIAQHTAQLANTHNLVSYEDEARRAAEEVIAAQSAVIDRATRRQQVIDAQLKQERQRLAVLEMEVDRSKKMARAAAQLARKATEAQQEIRAVAMREQNARLKSQESTRKAVMIARNAIDALAAEERKHATNGPNNTKDTGGSH